MAAGIKGTKGVVKNLTFPPEIWARIGDAALRRWSSPTQYIVRFCIDNIDGIAPRDLEPDA